MGTNALDPGGERATATACRDVTQTSLHQPFQGVNMLVQKWRRHVTRAGTIIR